jgi:uncharacterized UPF0160 family protein
MEKTIRVAVHNGIFHADDAFAVAALRLIHSQVEIVRTRDPEILASCDLRVDVGGEYDHSLRTYDHHQRGGAGERENGIPYAGFGLVWKHYGLDVVNAVTGTVDPIIAQRVEEVLVQKIDAGDCGVKLHDGDPKFFNGDRGVTAYTISHVVSTMNPSWHQEDQDFDRSFQHAVEFAEDILWRDIERAHGSTIAESLVRTAISSMDGQVVVLERFCPWQDVIVPECPEALFVVYPSVEGDWMVQAIPPELGSFDTRKSLPEDWRGLRDGDLQTHINIPSAIFTHPAGFIGGARERDDAIAMARLAVSHQ